MFQVILNLFSDYLIEIMGLMLVSALVFRWLMYKSSKYDQVYFLSFVREVEKNLELIKGNRVSPNKIETFINDLLNKIISSLPERSLRFSSGDKARKESQFGAKKLTSIRDYIGGKRTLVHGIQGEMAAFKGQFPPNYEELTGRIMDKDHHWVKLFGLIPIDKVSRMIDILPGIFVVLGIFGTFIGISMALPEITKINFENLEESGKVLSGFVLHVTFAMESSIAGILFSLILTVLNNLFPIRKVRTQISQKVEGCFENLWMSLHGTGDLMPDVLETLQLIESHLKHASETKSRKTGS